MFRSMLRTLNPYVTIDLNTFKKNCDNLLLIENNVYVVAIADGKISMSFFSLSLSRPVGDHLRSCSERKNL